MSFAVVAIATSAAGLLLGLGWLFAGQLMLRRWGITPTPQLLLVGRRLGAVYLSIAVMVFLGSNAPESGLRSALAAGLLLAMVLLAALGLIEYRARRANASILVSVALEIVLGAGYAAVLLG
jgi:hypothetical protein